ncbi:hypothetical protein D3C85_1001160 [compost metagenome]
MRPIEKLMYIVSLAYPLTAVPQIIKVYSTQNVESLALLSWILYVIFGTIFVIYAISERLKPLIIEGALWVAIYVSMVGAIVMYA